MMQQLLAKMRGTNITHSDGLAVILAILIAFALDAFLAVAGESSPVQLPGKTLSNDEIVLPDQSVPRSMLIVGFSRKSGTQAKSWRVMVLEDERWVHPVYNVVVLEGVPRFVRSFIKRGIRSGVPKDQRGNFVIVTERSAEWRALTGASDDDLAYVLVVDSDGRVCGAYSGAASTEALEDLLESRCDAAANLSIKKKHLSRGASYGYDNSTSLG